MNYRKIALSSALLALVLMMAGLTTARAQPQPGDGPGMMGGWRWGQPGTTTAQPIGSIDDARQAFQRYVDAIGNTDLTVGEIIQFQWNYYAVIESTSTGQGAFELLANPRTGAVFPEMGPNMMWNTEYGLSHGWTWDDVRVPRATRRVVDGFSRSGPANCTAMAGTVPAWQRH